MTQRTVLLMRVVFAMATALVAQQALAAGDPYPFTVNRSNCQISAQPELEAEHALYGTGVMRSEGGPGGALLLLGIDAINPCPAPYYIFLFTVDRIVLIAVLPGTPSVSLTPPDLQAAALLPLRLIGNGSGMGSNGEDACTQSPDYFLGTEGLVPANCP